ncbi:ArsR family transcriptional regulator [Paractinoplanes tereljensis]|uniref:ArsR family transcriptional regulator n=2 Tax=Paractinoplanes tereljensis TaxID=571912 RepID=A0A919TSJ2_9ACTN|nr:ArsR family transcriptional regulator [Actinoplanes tereljensis]
MRSFARRRQNTSRLLPLLRSPLLGELMAWICLHPEMNYSLAELARRFNVSQSAIGKEADRLAEAGLVRSEWRGNLRLLRAEPSNPLARPLTELLALTYGPIAVLADLLPAVPGVVEAYLYGSWAAHYAGEPGPPPPDVHVLVVGDADGAELAGAADLAERQLGRAVHLYQVSSMEWRWPERDPFLMSVRSSPAYALVGAPR